MRGWKRARTPGAGEVEIEESYLCSVPGGCACVRRRDRSRWNFWWSEVLNPLILAPGNVTGF